MSVFEILQQCKRAGLELRAKPNGNIAVRGPKDAITSDFVELLKSRKQEILFVLDTIRTFQESGMHGTVIQDVERYLERQSDKPVISCPYKGEPREIYPTVCQWHREEKDPECSGCKNTVLH